MIQEGNDYTVKVICFNIRPKAAKIYWRKLGDKDFMQADLNKISETWWMATIPSKSISGDFEYYITIDDGKEYLFPVSAPIVNLRLYKLKTETQTL